MIRTHAVPRAHLGAQRDGPLEPLVRPPGRGEVPALREVRVLRRPQCRRASSTRRRCSSTGSRVPARSGSSPASSRAIPAPSGPASAQYTIWCDDRGFVVEDGVLLRHAADEFVLTAAEPNLAYFADLVRPARRGRRSRTSRTTGRSSRSRARARGGSSAGLDQGVERLALLRAPQGADRRAQGRTSRAPATRATSATRSGAGPRTPWRSGTPSGRRPAATASLPFGLQALYMTRIEAGLLLLDVDFASRRFAWTDADRATPLELGLGWMLRGVRRPTTAASSAGDALRRELAGEDVPLPDDGYRRRLAGLEPPPRRGGPRAAHGPRAGPGGDVPLRRRRGAGGLRDELHVLARPPAPRRHRARARSPRRRPGSRVNLEIPINHRYVARRGADLAPAPLQPAAEDG